MIYVDFETMLERRDSCDNNPEASYTIEINKDPTCGFSMFIKFAHDKSKKNPSSIEVLIVWINFLKY